ncbi:glycosyltransferase [Vibrio vulnificus]
MKRITYVITKPIIGGAQVWLKDQVDLLIDDYDISVITSSYGWLTDNINARAKVYLVPAMSKRISLKAIFSLVKLISTEIKPDVVISSSANAGFYARLVKIFYKHRSIYISHGWSCIYNGGVFINIFIFVERILSFLTDCIWCVSNEDSRKAREIIGCNPAKVFTLRNSVFPKKRHSYRSAACLKLLFVGRLETPKRPDLLIEAVKNFPDIELTIIGDGRLREQLSGNNNVEFLGEVESFDEFHCYDAFALISDSEGLPVSALEAASSGIPLILSNVGGCNELVSTIQPNGILVLNNLDSITSALFDLKDSYPAFYTAAQAEADKFCLLNDKHLIIKIIEGV